MVVRAGHCGSIHTFRLPLAALGGPQGPIRQGIVKTIVFFSCFYPGNLLPFVTAREVMGKKLCIIALMDNGPGYAGICDPSLSDIRSGHNGRIINRQNRRFFLRFSLPLTAAAGQTAGLIAASRTSPEPPVDGLQKSGNTHG
jgi:hypothetical protein